MTAGTRGSTEKTSLAEGRREGGQEETEIDFGLFVAGKAGRKYQRKTRAEAEKKGEDERNEGNKENHAEADTRKKKKKTAQEEAAEGSFSDVLRRNLHEMKHSQLVRELNVHFRNLGKKKTLRRTLRLYLSLVYLFSRTFCPVPVLISSCFRDPPSVNPLFSFLFSVRSLSAQS